MRPLTASRHFCELRPTVQRRGRSTNRPNSFSKYFTLLRACNAFHCQTVVGSTTTQPNPIKPSAQQVFSILDGSCSCLLDSRQGSRCFTITPGAKPKFDRSVNKQGSSFGRMATGSNGSAAPQDGEGVCCASSLLGMASVRTFPVTPTVKFTSPMKR